MLQTIHLKNYMAHADTSLELGKGVTVLTGPNNCGKSAVVSALQTVCHNESGNYMVRHGTKETSVTLTVDGDHSVMWRRKGAVVSYSIDGEEFFRLQRKVPDPLHRLLKMSCIEGEGSNGFDVHIAEQKKPIFLLDESASKAAVFFASTSDAALLVEMQRRHREKLKAATTRRRWVYEELERIEKGLKLPVPIARLEQMVVEIEERYRLLQEERVRAVKLRTLISDLDQRKSQLETCRRKQKILSVLIPPPELESVSGRMELLNEIGKAEGRITQWRKERESVDSQLEKVRENLRQHLAQHPLCPVCGSELNIDTVLEGGHG